MTQQSSESDVASQSTRGITPERYGAIHRALMSGLLGNIGFKKEQFEYTGTRGRKFHLFPGSSLFSRKPLWVVSAELTETTRLYARTVARIEPEWIEKVAEHLLNREYSEPYYHRDSAHVLASEKVSLFGLVVVPRRRVHYGPIDPKASREIFIRQGLVEGEYHSDAPWARNNRQLIREIELAEAKLRRRDLLVDAQSRFAFFDARIPAGIFNGPLFEKWRRTAEQADRRVLFMKREDLIVPGPEAPAEQFPEYVIVNDSVRIALSYLFDPGNEFDGVTATIPIALLNQLPQEPFDWLAPGYLAEKVTELIRTMSKDLRVLFVPVPDTVRAVVPMIRFGDGALHEQLAWTLGKHAGRTISPQTFCADYLPDYLRMNFRVVDEAGKTLAVGRDLEAIRRKLRVELKQTFEELPTSQWHRDGITRWDFDDLPEKVEIRRPGIVVRGFPAIVDKGTGVALRLLDNTDLAARSTLAGLRRLFLLQLGGDRVKHLQRHLPDIDAMCLRYATIGPGDELRRDLLALSADRALFGDEPVVIRRRDDFVDRAEKAWQRLSEASREVCDAVGQTLELHQSLRRRLGQVGAPLLAANVADIRRHLESLLPGGFVASTPWAWLKHFPRYLKAAEHRLTKLQSAGLTRDTQSMNQVAALWKKYVDRRELQAFQGVDDPNLPLYRWLIEELRVSLFAQELRTSQPVSAKRLEQLFAELK